MLKQPIYNRFKKNTHTSNKGWFFPPEISNHQLQVLPNPFPNKFLLHTSWSSRIATWDHQRSFFVSTVCIKIEKLKYNIYIYTYMAASQNARSGSTPKTHRRSRPPIQTDPDLTIQTDPDLTIQTYDPDPFVLCWLEIFFFKVLQSITLYYKVLLQYYFVLQSTTLYYKVRCLVIS